MTITSSVPWEEQVLMLAGVPRELELSEVKVSAWERPGTSRTDGGEMDRFGRVGEVRVRW